MGSSVSRANGPRVHIPNEMLSEMLRGFSLGQLHIVAGVNVRLRDVVKTRLRIRIHYNLSKFIAEHKVEDFMALLNANASVVGGSIAQGAITPEIFYDAPPSNLNVFVPHGVVDTVSRFLIQDLAYTIDGVEVNRIKKSVESVVFLSDGPEKRIIICESTSSSCLRPILRSSFTSQVNFLTANHIYCVYPHLTPNLQAMQRLPKPHGPAGKALEDKQLSVLLRQRVELIENDDEIPFCRENQACREFRRRLFVGPQEEQKTPLEDIGIMCWDEDHDPEELLAQNHDQFSLGGTCKVPHCLTRFALGARCQDPLCVAPITQ
ncbi:hypothetical protein GALMADRAFT_146768 [Galerina marginata CBS 339.88]|uniref:Uncharacterized protein n=1 Tax=Galerina marginata (strain CBS 339.88) TaxID=685588 RepID=A0A067SAZ6_GALM3|nr:hypothetical protein GALMADRAFT_146768 [Galerina marginata CBS 339.88]